MITESLLVWSAAAAVCVAVVVPYVVVFRRRMAADHARKSEAVQLGIDRPMAQFPFIDPEHCIGCGACVRACPEGDVLGVVGGTAVVINGLRCVGHGRCEDACPVGAIAVGLGDLRSRKDVPLLSDTYETTLPGVSIVGELGGLSLVRNAVRQGREVAQRLTAHDDDALDVIIGGSGPSGLSAAAEAAARGLRCLVLEKESSLGGSLLHYPRRKMVLLQPVEISADLRLDREEYSKEHLLEIFERLVVQHALDVRFEQTIERIARDGETLLVTTAAGTRFRAHHVILALGRRGSPRKLDIPGEELPKVMYRLLDAESYRRQRVLVVGGGDSAVEAAIGLAQQPDNEVTLSYRRDKLVRIKKKNEEAFGRLVARGSIRTLFESQPLAIEPNRVILRTNDGTTALENDYVFIFAGGVPPFELLERSGIRMGGG